MDERFRTPRGVPFTRLLDLPLERCPDKTALVDDHESVDFATLDARARRLAGAMHAAGARPGDRVALVLPNSVAFVVAEIAALRAGMVKVPLNFRFHPREVRQALDDCEPAVLVSDAGFAERLLALGPLPPSVRAVWTVGGTLADCARLEHATESGEPLAQCVEHGPDDPILIRYTGGTTGRPKGIVHTAASFTGIHLDVVRELSLRPDDVALHLGHLSHGLNFMWAAFHAVGATQVLRERFDPQAVLDDLARHRITFVYMVPTMVQRVLAADDGSADVSALRSFLYASAPMPVPVLRAAIARFGNVFTQVYTLSEAPVITTIMRPEEHVELTSSVGPRLASCGREVPTMALRLVDDAMRDVPAGEVGEIAVRSSNNMAGYWRLPEETARTVVDGWLRTGDLARRDEHGFLHLVDRKKDVIITGAFNVYPKEVEDVLYLHPGVAACAVVGVPDADWGEAIRAYVVRAPGSTVDAEALVALARDHLADYKKPRSVVFVDALPLSPIGKVMRRALRESSRG
ncbi:MAG: AMP-binding protein [Ectothiorhodospiraceae bacterium]|nr:AMP-binding protein [Chromatiales bacterium]MCP5155531.1 AMP-binding protein [Ectothiorhodospiraceae bacterium]